MGRKNLPVADPDAEGIWDLIQPLAENTPRGIAAVQVEPAELQLRDPDRWVFQHVILRYDPKYDMLRGDPRFERALRDTLPKGAKPFDQKTEDGGSSSAKATDGTQKTGKTFGDGK